MKEDLKKGFLFTAVGKFSNLGISLIINMVLSRLLTPNEFGVVAVVMLFTAFFAIVVDGGLGPVIIQNKNLSKKDIASLFNFSGIFGVILMVLFIMFGQIIQLIYQDPSFKNISSLLSLILFFNGLSVVPNALCLRAKMFKEVYIRMIIGNIIGGVVGIATALNGFGVYSLCLQNVSASCTNFFLIYFFSKLKWQPVFDFGSIKKVYSFASRQLGTNFLNYFSRNFDTLIISKTMTPVDLGNYNKAYQLLQYPCGIFNSIITPVLQPVLSEHQDNLALIKKMYIKLFHLLFLIGFPLAIFLSLNAEDIIMLMFGSQWGFAIKSFQFLALTLWIQITSSTITAIYQSRNLSRWMLKSEIISSGILITSILIGALLGSIVTVAKCYCIGQLLSWTIAFSIFSKIALKDNIVILFKQMIFPMIIGIVAGVCLYIVKMFIFFESSFANLFFYGLLWLFFVAIMLFTTQEHKAIIDFIKNH